MRPPFINFAGDPFNSDAVSEYPHEQSDGYGGPNEDLVAPAAANYPPVTPARYFLYLPFVPDTTDLIGARPMLLKDVTGGVALTRVTGVPGVNQYRVAPDDSRTPHVIELNSGQAGHVIAYDIYSIGSIISADDANARAVKRKIIVASDSPYTWICPKYAGYNVMAEIVLIGKGGDGKYSGGASGKIVKYKGIITNNLVFTIGNDASVGVPLSLSATKGDDGNTSVGGGSQVIYGGQNGHYPGGNAQVINGGTYLDFTGGGGGASLFEKGSDGVLTGISSPGVHEGTPGVGGKDIDISGTIESVGGDGVLTAASPLDGIGYGAGGGGKFSGSGGTGAPACAIITWWLE